MFSDETDKLFTDGLLLAQIFSTKSSHLETDTAKQEVGVEMTEFNIFKSTLV